MSLEPQLLTTRFTDQSVINKVRAAEDAWNARDVESLVLANTIDCQWRNRTDLIWGREQIRAYIVRRLRATIEPRAILELWAWRNQHIAIRFALEFRDDSGSWFRAFGNENWECDVSGLVRRSLTSVNEQAIKEYERLLLWPVGPRPADHPGLSELAL